MKAKGIILGILIMTALAHNHFKCVFDENNKDLHQISAQTAPDVSSVQPTSGRMLLTITRNPIRITLDTSSFNTITAGTNGAKTTTSTNLAFLLKVLNVAKYFYSTRIKVYPLTTIVAPSVCVDYNTPSNDRNFGVSASDLHIYARYITDKATAYGATGKSCKYFGDGSSPPDGTLQLGRPTMGRIIFNTYSTVDSSSSLTNMLFQSVTSTTLHEMMHILGFDSTLYARWLVSDETNARYSNTYTSTFEPASDYTSASIRANSYFLTTPNVKAWTQQFFGCSTAPGMLLQNEDTTEPIGFGGGSHWERNVMYDQLMTGTQLGPSAKYFSGLTFAILRDMGWYTVDSTFNETSNFGYKKDCDFLLKGCSGGTSFSEFCDSASLSQTSLCQSNFMGKAICSSTSSLMADGCGLFGPYFSCVDPNSVNDGYQSYTQQVYGTNSFCVKSTLGTVALPSTVQSRCYPFVCGTSSITFTIGSNTIVCLSSEKGQTKTIPSFTGTLQCPEFDDYCTNSRKSCPSWCSKNGYCMGGVCNCITGFYGADCSKTICSSGLYYNSLTSSCVSVCPSGYYQNSYNTNCDKCAPACDQCFGQPTICSGCVSTASNPQYFYNSICYSQCPSGTYAINSNFTCQACDPASFCKTCFGTSSNCTSCSSGRYLSQPVFGTCISSCPTTGTFSVTDVINFICVSTCANNLVLVNNGVNNNTCQYCANSTFKLTQTSACVAECPNFYYANNISWLCAQCDSSCLTCTGGLAENCASCSPTATLRYLLLNMCWSVCPGGYYPNNTASACQICPKTLNCGNCTYNNVTDNILCTSCAYGYFLLGSVCSSNCGANKFPFLGNNSCMGCHSSCATCTGPEASFCKTCASGFLITNLTGSFCITACPTIGYFPSAPNCLTCDSSCYKCSGASQSECTACPNSTYLSSGYCRMVCPPATFPNDQTSSCTRCDGSCKFCFGPTIDNCTACADQMVLFNFTCTLQCPAGYTVNQWNVCFQTGLKVVVFAFLLLVALVI